MRGIVIILLWSLITSACRAGENLVTNGGFEDGMQAWSGQGDVGIDTSQAHNGKASLRIGGMKAAGQRHRSSQTLHLNQTRPQAFEVSFWGKASGLSRVSTKILYKADLIFAVELAVHFNDKTTRYFYQPLRIKKRRNVGEWVFRKAIFTPDKPIKTVTVYCINQANEAEVWFDDIEVRLSARLVHTPFKTPEPPKLDGRLDDACWRAATKRE